MFLFLTKEIRRNVFLKTVKNLKTLLLNENKSTIFADLFNKDHGYMLTENIN